MKKLNKKTIAISVFSLFLIIFGVYLILYLGKGKYVPGVVCWGDSLTAGAGGAGITYPAVLDKLIKETINANIPVVKMGVGGEDVNTIVGRAGGAPYVVNAFTIPAGIEPVEISFKSSNGSPVAPLRQGEGGINDCYIGGIQGKISIAQENYKSKEYRYFFTRTFPGKSVDIENGTNVITRASLQYGDYIKLIFVGQNLGWTDYKDLIAKQRSIINSNLINQDKYLILGLTSGTKEERSGLEDAMEKEYGDKYINLREYLSTNGLADAGIVPNQADLADMEIGLVPRSLLSDKVHLNSVGYTLVAQQVYERMVKLNYFSTNSFFDPFYRSIWMRLIEFNNHVYNRYTQKRLPW